MTSYQASPELVALVTKHEGRRLRPYTDIVGKLTIGVGRNLTDNGISPTECDQMLASDLEIAAHQAAGVIGDAVFSALDPVRQAALIDLSFNVGAQRLSLFVKLLSAVRANDWQMAHDEALNSKWAAQVGSRAVDISNMLLSGNWPA